MFRMLVAEAEADIMLVPHAAGMVAEQLLQQVAAVTVLIKIPMEQQAVPTPVAGEAEAVTGQLQDKQEVPVLLLFVIQIHMQQQQALQVVQLSQLQVGIGYTPGLVQVQLHFKDKYNAYNSRNNNWIRCNDYTP
jgi:hypothetical protein